MATVGELIEETRRLLFTGQREERNKLSLAITSSATTLNAIYPMGGIQRGAKLSLNLEDMYVWDISSQTATVERGQWGSTAAAHVINSLIHVNPKFSNWEIFNALNDELNALSSPVNGLYNIVTVELQYSPTISGYNLSVPGYSTIYDVYEVRYEVPGVSDLWPISTNWELSRGMSTDEFASGQALFIHDAYPNKSVMVKAKVPYVEAAADISASPDVPDSIVDILPIGAAWRLTAPREVKRNFDEVQGDTRRAQEVPPGANLGGSRELGRVRQARINEEAARLKQLYPPRKRRYPYQASYS